MLRLKKGRYATREAMTDNDVLSCQRLRHLAFIATTGATEQNSGLDADAFDSLCRHVMVEDVRTQTLVCCFRLLPLPSGAEIGCSYSAQYYELSGLEAFDGPMVEMGRFCVHPDWSDPDILRVAWGAMTRMVDHEGIELLFGCSSFKGTEAEAYSDAFALLNARHLAPKRWLPRVKAPSIFPFAKRLARRKRT